MEAWRVSSRGHRINVHARNYHFSYACEEPYKKMIRYLEESPCEVTQGDLVRAGGFDKKSRVAICTLTMYDCRVYQSDDGKIGLAGVHCV